MKVIDFAAIKAIAFGFLISAFILALPSPAHADTVGVLRDLGTITGVLPAGCRYGSEIQQAQCYAQAAARHRDTQRYNAQRRASQVRNDVQERQQAQAHLIQACRLGDQWSCQRSRQIAVDPRTVQIIQNLEAACRSGDRASCDRLSG